MPYPYGTQGAPAVGNGLGGLPRRATSTSGPPVGEAVYTTPGTYEWTAPAGVTSVCAVCVGAGGSPSGSGSTYQYASGGGGLGWKNNITVSPGAKYTVVVGASSGESYFVSAATVRGGPGHAGSDNTRPPGTYVGDGGGNGGLGGTSNTGGGGGAGGYSGAGGDGGASTGSSGVAGTGGGGGGGGGKFTSTTMQTGMGGGGVGLYGQGTNGTGGYEGYPGKGGSNGQPGGFNDNMYNGGLYGGGCAHRYGVPGTGAVRIIWGPGRSFPSNAA